jgi:hypothetical protein
VVLFLGFGGVYPPQNHPPLLMNCVIQILLSGADNQLQISPAHQQGIFIRMFKALNKLDGGEIIILDPGWRNQLSALRSLDRQDALACPYCLQPVRVRAGNYKRWHFAHKHLENCRYENESPVLLQTRAVLYDWLAEKFGPQSVTLEKQLEHAVLPRHIDCWVKSGKHYFAYWIFETRKSPIIRDMVLSGFARVTAKVNYLFIADLMNRDPLRRDHLYLTTTERAFMVESSFDRFSHENHTNRGKSLQYLDPNTRTLYTYRGLQMYHSPQLYRGTLISDSLSDVKISLTSGELIYPIEADLMQSPKEQLKELGAGGKSMATYLPRHFRKRPFPEQSTGKLSQLPTPDLGSYRMSQDDLSVGDRDQEQLPQCVFCGRVTGDYWYHDRTTNTCKCRACFQEGKW